MSPMRLRSPTTVTAAAVSAPEIADAIVSVATTSMTTKASVTWTIGLPIIDIVLIVHNLRCGYFIYRFKKLYKPYC